MADARITVLETQHDDLAARVACLEEELRLLRRVLQRQEVLERLGIVKTMLEPINVGFAASAEKSRQCVARQDALEAARKDALLHRLAIAERYSNLTGKSIAEAWEKCASS